MDFALIRSRISDFPSLNLSHAVQIMCYHLFRASAKRLPKRNFTPLSSQRMDEICSHLIENFRSIGFFKIDGSEEMPCCLGQVSYQD